MRRLAAAGKLSVHLQGSYLADIPDNHVVRLYLNGHELGAPSTWSGHDEKTITVDFAQEILIDGDNSLEVVATLVDGLDFDEFYLDSIDVTYQRQHVAAGDQLHATAGGSSAVTVDGFSGGEVWVFDLTTSRQPVALTGVSIGGEGGAFSATFGVSDGAMPFVATTPEAIEGPADIVVDFESSLREPSNRGRYVIVAGPGLEAEAAVLAAYREQQGLPAVVAPVVDIYDEFTGGVANPWAIQLFLQYANETWALPPQYVFLAGDGTLDYKDIWGAGEGLVPAPMTVAHGGLVPSDNILADWHGDDGVPEVAIGRLPAHSPAELSVYRNKIIAFEAGSGEWKQRALWLADAADEGGEFPEDLQQLVEGLPASFNNERIVVDWLGDAAARERTLQSWNSGAVMVQFLGHGALDFIANGGLVTTGDVSSMTNAAGTPLLAALTCMVGRFDIPDYDVLSEALLLKSGGGSIGVWSPSAFSMNEDAALLGSYQVETIGTGEHSTIGDSVRAALAAYAASGEGDPTLPRIFIFLGDPATRVDW